MDCPHCNRTMERCTHAPLHQEIERLRRLVAGFEAATQKIAEPKVIMVRSLISHRTQKPRIEPESVEWYAHGRPATRAEVQESIEQGLPSLESVARLQAGAMEELRRYEKRLEKWLPALEA